MAAVFKLLLPCRYIAVFEVLELKWVLVAFLLFSYGRRYATKHSHGDLILRSIWFFTHRINHLNVVIVRSISNQDLQGLSIRKSFIWVSRRPYVLDFLILTMYVISFRAHVDCITDHQLSSCFFGSVWMLFLLLNSILLQFQFGCVKFLVWFHYLML